MVIFDGEMIHCFLAFFIFDDDISFPELYILTGSFVAGSSSGWVFF